MRLGWLIGSVRRPETLSLIPLVLVSGVTLDLVPRMSAKGVLVLQHILHCLSSCLWWSDQTTKKLQRQSHVTEMPFRHAFRRYSTAQDVHMVSVPLNESLDQWCEQEMDFTCYPQSSNMTAYDAQADATASSGAAEDFHHFQSKPVVQNVPHQPTSIPSNQYDPGCFTYSQSSSMDSDVPFLDASVAPGIGTRSILHQPEAEVPAATSTPAEEKICPLITGDVGTCQPSRCGPDAPCLNFVNLPPIEECTSVPCISPPNNEHTPTSSSAVSRANRLSMRRNAVSRSPSSASTASLDMSATQAQPRAQRKTDKASAASNKPLSKSEAKQRAKAAHSLVEKKYRENLNTKLISLNTTLQNAHYGPKRFEQDDSDLEFDADVDRMPGTMANPSYSQTTAAAARAAAKFRKSDVLSDAMDYVNQTEVEMRHMENEIRRLNERVRTLGKLVRCEDCSLLKGIVGMQVQPV